MVEAARKLLDRALSHLGQTKLRWKSTEKLIHRRNQHNSLLRPPRNADDSSRLVPSARRHCTQLASAGAFLHARQMRLGVSRAWECDGSCVWSFGMWWKENDEQSTVGYRG